MADSKARVVKTQDIADEAELVFGEEVRITTEGQRHLGAVIGSQEYKDQQCSGNIKGWRENIELLAEIVKSQTHAAYVAFTKGYKSKLNILCVQLTLLKTTWNQLMKTIFSFQFFLVKRKRSLMS